MRRAILSIVGALLFAGPATAADIDRTYTPENAYQQTPTKIVWNGFYIGGSIGYGNANHDLSVRDYFKDYCGDIGEEDQFGFEDGFKDISNRAKYLVDGVLTCATPEAKDGYNSVVVTGDSREVANLDGLNSAGLVGDVRLGYDQQLGSRFVLGVFGTYGFSDMKADGEVVGVGSFDLERGDDWSIGARGGVLVNERTLLYILAAYTETEYDLNVTVGPENFAKTTDFSGVTVGGGIEFALNEGVFLGIEGSHAFYDDENIFDVYDPAKNQGLVVNDDLGETKVMATVKLKLNSF